MDSLVLPGLARLPLIVPIADSAMLSAKLVRGATLKVYRGGPHGMCTVNKDEVNEDLLAFIKR